MRAWTDYPIVKLGVRAWTDYPIVELGDEEGKLAPVRECDVISYDGDKYCRVNVVVITPHQNVLAVTIKACYLYSAPGRIGEVPPLTRRVLTYLELKTKDFLRNAQSRRLS